MNGLLFSPFLFLFFHLGFPHTARFVFVLHVTLYFANYNGIMCMCVSAAAT